MTTTPSPRRILALSSQVAFGHVGLSAAVPVLQRLGHAVTPLPTVMLSNHPGWPQVAGHPVPVADLRAMIGAIEANGWLGDHDTVLTGYLPSAAHVALAAEVIDRMRAGRPDLRVVVDPVLGDTPKGLYVTSEVATAIRDALIGRADVITPNLFELGWLSGAAVEDKAGVIAAAQILAPRVVVTSAPMGPGSTGCIEICDGKIREFSAALQADVPNGVGDVFSALIAGGYDIGPALGHLQLLIEESTGADHLRIVESASSWTNSVPLMPAKTRVGQNFA